MELEKPSFISKGRIGCAEVVRKADRWQGMYALQRGPSKIVANTRRGDWNLLIYGVICVKSQKWLCEPKLRFFSSLKMLTIFLFQALLVRLRSPKIREINQKDSILEPQWGMSVQVPSSLICCWWVPGVDLPRCVARCTPPWISCPNMCERIAMCFRK